MAAILKIKRGLTSTSIPTLASGELGYSMGTGTSSNGGDRLYIGTGTDTNGVAAAIAAIGGKYFTDLLGATPGVLTASNALIVDANKKLDELRVDSLTLNGEELKSDGTLKLTAATNIELGGNATFVSGVYAGSQVQLDTYAVNLTQNRGGSINLKVGDNGSVTSTLSLLTDGSLVVPGTIKTLSNGNLTLAPNGTGKVSIAGAFTLPRVDGSTNQVLKTDGAGNVTWADAGSAATGSVTSVDIDGSTTGLTFSGGPITSTGTFTLGGVLAVGFGGTGTTTKTGTGSVVLSDNAVLVTPNLGVPSAATLTNATGLPVSTGISGLGTNIASFLATPSSSNLAAALTTKTGTGIVVFSTTPTITTSILTDSASFDLFNTTATTVNFAGAATSLNIGAVTGTTTINNNVALKGTTTVSGSILPDTDSTIDLGSATKRFRTLFLKGSTIDLGGATLSGSAASGVTLSSINGTPIGDVTPSTAVFTTLSTTGNVTIGGDLTVNGTLTSINSTTVEVADKMIELGKTGSPTEATASGAGIQVTGTSAHNFLYNNITQSWTSSEHINLVSGKVFAINGVSVLEATSLGSTVTGSSLTSVGTLTTGTWNASTIGLGYGGTGNSLTAVNGGITYSTSSGLAISDAGSSGQFLMSNGAGAPTWTNTIDGGTY